MTKGRSLALCVLVLQYLSAVSSESKVVSLDASTFDAYILKTPLVLVEFYAPWCGHCKQLIPEYEKAANILAAEDLPLAKIDAADEKNQKLAETYEVQGFPTIKLFKNKKATDYLGERTSDAIVAFMKKRASPAVKELQHDSDATAWKDEFDAVVMGFFPDKNSEGFKAFESAASEADDVPFGVVHDNGIRNLFRAEPSQLILYKKFDDKRIVYEGEMNPKDIAAFATANAMPLVLPFNEANAVKIFGGSVKVHLLVFVDGTKEPELIEKLKAPAVAHKGKVLTVTIGPEEEQITEYFGVTANDMPAVRLVDMRDAGMKKYSYDKPVIDEASLETFLQDFFDGRLQASLKSEDEPAAHESSVKVIVSKTFQKEVMESEKDVLVEFYAPWCGHCKELAPRYEALAEKLKDKEKLVIAKVNGELNEIKDVQVDGFPTLRLWAEGEKHNPKEYTGERTAEAIEAWLQKEVTNKWDTQPAADAAAAAEQKHEGSEL